MQCRQALVPGADLERMWAAAPGGAREAWVCCGPVWFALTGLTGTQAELVREVWAPTGGQPPPSRSPIPVRVLQANPLEFQVIQAAGRPLWLAVEHHGGRVDLAGQDWLGRLSTDAPLSATVACPPGRLAPLQCALENVMRAATAYASLHAGGVMLHSGAILGDGGAWVGFGRSGAGKTTLCRKAEADGLTVLGDELHVVTPATAPGAGLSVQALPLAGDFGRARPPPPDPLPVDRLVHLCQGLGPRLRPMSPGQAVGLLLASTPWVNADPWVRDRLWQVLEAVTAASPVAELQTTLGCRPWGLLLRGC